MDKLSPPTEKVPIIPNNLDKNLFETLDSTHYKEGEILKEKDDVNANSNDASISSMPIKGQGRKRGRIKKKGIIKKERKILSYTSKDNQLYKIGECAFVETNRPDMPYCICSIQGFKLSKRDTLFAQVKWYYRSSEVPDSVYQHLVQDRHFENNSGLDLVIKNPCVKVRELFCSDTLDSCRASLLRGHCTVIHYKDIFAAKDFKPLPNTFFYILGYNPETKRLATTQGEIRIGPSHQAKLPECMSRPDRNEIEEPVKPMESIAWRPSKIMDGDLMMFLRAARSMAAFAGMCDGGTPEDGCQAASSDETTISALNQLHRHHYDTGKALQALVKCPVPRSIDKKWNSEESKRFAKGLRQYGKNFFKIRRELLSHKETSELVEYYYYWKKTPAAANTRPHRRGRRSVLKRPSRSTRPSSASGEFLESSASEVSDESAEDSDTKDLPGYTCQKCYSTTSKEWHHVGRDRILLCTECKLVFKKYGENQPIDETDIAPFLFKPVNEDETPLNMRTRRSKESTNKNRKKDRESSSPETEDNPITRAMSDRKSPSTDSSSSTEKKRTSKSPLKSRKRSREESISKTEDKLEINIKKERVESPIESSTDSSISGKDEDENGNEGDVENNQDDNSSGSCSLPSPTNPALTRIKKERESPPLPSRSRSPSKSPEREAESPEPTAPRSPSPPPKIVDQEIFKSENAIFIKHWSRGENSCCRCDWTFIPKPDSKLARKREEIIKKVTSPVIKEEKKPCATPENRSADAQITSSFISQYSDRHTPRATYPDTPALRQLGEFARPHVLGHDVPRSLPHLPGGNMFDPLLQYRLPGLYPGGRERLELELERDKRERDAREREIRERELRDIEMREKMKEIEMKQGLERAHQFGIDPQMLELQRRFGIPPGTPGYLTLAGTPGPSHLPGIYPPTSLSNDLMARERERLERLGMPNSCPTHLSGESPYSNSVERLSAERLHAERMALVADPVARLQMSAGLLSPAHTHTHAHAHTHLHLHDPNNREGLQRPPLPPTSAAFGTPFLHPFLPGADPLTAAAAVAASSGGHPLFPFSGYPPHPLLVAGRERELPPEILARYANDPVLQQQLSIQAAHQQEMLQRQLLLERERQLANLPH